MLWRLADSRHALLIVLTAGALLYTWRLGEAPVAVANDEAHFAAHAQSLAAAGRDLNGVALPLFVEMIDPLVPDEPGTARWQPVLFYLMSACLAVLPFSEFSIRLPVVLLSLASMALIYALVHDWLGSRRLALAATLLLALTPAQFIMSRQAIDYLGPMPFALGWLYCLGRYLRGAHPIWLGVAGSLLGVVALSHISGWGLAPLFLLITIAHQQVWTPRAMGALAAGVSIPAGLTVAWLIAHPGVMHELLARYGVISDPAWSGATAAARTTLSDYISIYWDYYSPSFLFFAGGSHPAQTTSRAGVFLLPLALLIPAGLWASWRQPRPLSGAVTAAFLAAPLPVVLIMGPLGEDSIARAIMLVPLGVLLAACGLQWLWRSGRHGRGAVVAASLFLPLQFAPFLQDYFGEYQQRLAPRIDALHTGAVAAFAIEHDARTPVPAVFLSDDNKDSKAVRWRFHLWKAQRQDLWARTRYFTSVDAVDAVPPGSLLVFFPGDARAATLFASGRYTLLETLRHPSGEAASVVLLRRP